MYAIRSYYVYIKISSQMSFVYLTAMFLTVRLFCRLWMSIWMTETSFNQMYYGCAKGANVG